MASKFQYNEHFWANEIKKYLFGRLDALWSAENNQLNEDLVKFLTAISEANGQNLKWISTLYHIAQNNGAWQFVVHDIPDYIRNLSHKTSIFAKESNKVKGRVLWDRTYIKRKIMKNYSNFVVEDTVSSLDTPENQLLLFYLNELASINIPINWSSRSNSDLIGNKLVQMVNSSNDLLQSSYFREVTKKEIVSTRMILAAQRNKHLLYSQLAKLWIEYDCTVYRPSLEKIKELLIKGWIHPKMDNSLDDLFEFYVLICAINAVEKCLANLHHDINVEYNFIKANGSKAVAKISSPLLNAEILYDSSLKTLFKSYDSNSLYRKLFTIYEGLQGSLRRPDVLINLECSKSGRKIPILIEAKNTNATSNYANDSIYKVLGYLKDYSGFWQEFQTPKAVLAFPFGIEIKNPNDLTWLQQDISLISGEIEGKIREILEYAIGNALC